MVITLFTLPVAGCTPTSTTHWITKTETVTQTQLQTATQIQAITQTTTITQPAITTTITQTVTETPLLSEILYSDSFDQVLTNWTIYSDSDGSAIVRDGALHIKDYTASDVACDSYPGESFTDLILEVEMTFEGGSANN